MIPLRTTALIAAMSLVGAVTPAAFAQLSTVIPTQSNSFTATVDQSISQTAEGGGDVTQGQARASVYKSISKMLQLVMTLPIQDQIPYQQLTRAQ